AAGNSRHEMDMATGRCRRATDAMGPSARRAWLDHVGGVRGALRGAPTTRRLRGVAGDDSRPSEDRSGQRQISFTAHRERRGPALPPASRIRPRHRCDLGTHDRCAAARGRRIVKLLPTWADLPEAERIARTRCLRLAVRLIAGGSAWETEAVLAQAES